MASGLPRFFADHVHGLCSLDTKISGRVFERPTDDIEDIGGVGASLDIASALAAHHFLYRS